jgi:hypothetical protein
VWLISPVGSAAGAAGAATGAAQAPNASALTVSSATTLQSRFCIFLSSSWILTELTIENDRFRRTIGFHEMAGCRAIHN